MKTPNDIKSVTTRRLTFVCIERPNDNCIWNTCNANALVGRERDGGRKGHFLSQLRVDGPLDVAVR